MGDVPVLQGERVTLRPPRLEDIDARLKLGIDPEIHHMYGGSRDDLRPMTPDARSAMGAADQ